MNDKPSMPPQPYHSTEEKKDHQRMMVDRMFMIVKIVRSFLTAVTPTAVRPTAAILLEFT